MKALRVYNDRGRVAVANSTNYLYNALGQMIEKSGTAGTTVLMQDESGHLIGEYNGSGHLIEETVWLGDIPVATLQPNGSGGVNIYYVHTDHLNTPRKVAQPTTGTLAWRWDMDPFGSAAPNQNPGGLGTFPYNLRFPGQYYMTETGLNQNWMRDYDPLTARYVESDPAGIHGGIATYSYATANPVSNFDRLGLEPTGEAKQPKIPKCFKWPKFPDPKCPDCFDKCARGVAEAQKGCLKDCRWEYVWHPFLLIGACHEISDFWGGECANNCAR